LLLFVVSQAQGVVYIHLLDCSGDGKRIVHLCCCAGTIQHFRVLSISYILLRELVWSPTLETLSQSGNLSPMSEELVLLYCKPEVYNLRASYLATPTPL
jgi:hypothetical protein